MEGISDGCGGSQLRALRSRAGLTLKQAAAQTGFSLSHLSNVERGVRTATDDVVRAYTNLRCIAFLGADEGRFASALPADGDAPGRNGNTADSTACGIADDFGTRLMRLRLASGLSLVRLAQACHVSKSYLGNLECGRRYPSPAVAAACDAHLAADGVLLRLAADAEHRPQPPEATVLTEPPSLKQLDRRCALDPQSVAEVDERQLMTIRRQAQQMQPGPLVAEAARYAFGTACAARVAETPRRPTLWLLAARAAEITGWLVEEAGDEALAARWTETAAVWATFGGDRDMRGYQWERRALGALYRGCAGETVALARRAAAEPGVSPRITGLALRREAQGHALAGDRAACERALDAAANLLARGPLSFPHGPSWGPNSIGDQSSFVPAACLVDLGAWREAAALIGPAPAAQVPSGAVRTRARCTVRGALAFALGGELDHACALIESALPDVARVGSATIGADIRRLIAVLSRHPGHPRIRTLLPDLHNVARLR